MRNYTILTCLLMLFLLPLSVHAKSYASASVTITKYSIDFDSGISDITWINNTTQSWISNGAISDIGDFLKLDVNGQFGYTSVSYSEEHRNVTAYTSNIVGDHFYAKSYLESGYYYLDNKLKALSNGYGWFTVNGDGNITIQIDYIINFDIKIENDFNALFNWGNVSLGIGELSGHNSSGQPELIDPVNVNDNQERVLNRADASQLKETYSGSLSVTKFFANNEICHFDISASTIFGGAPTVPISGPPPQPAPLSLAPIYLLLLDQNQ